MNPTNELDYTNCSCSHGGRYHRSIRNRPEGPSGPYAACAYGISDARRVTHVVIDAGGRESTTYECGCASFTPQGEPDRAMLPR